MDTAQRVELLKSAGPFALLEDAERDWLAERMTVRTVPLGGNVFQKGDPGDAFYVVVSGRARVVGVDASGREVSLNVLTRGDHFGEGALLSEAPRGATVRAADDLTLLKLSRDVFERCLAEHPRFRGVLDRYLENTGIQNFLKQFTALGAVPTRVLRELVRELEPIKVPAGEAVIREGETGDKFYIVRSGALEARRKEGNDSRAVGYIGPGEFFGELALLTGAPRAATVLAREPSEIYSLSRAGFERAIEASSELRARIDRVVQSYGRDKAATLMGRATQVIKRPAKPEPAPEPAPVSRPEEIEDRLGAKGPAWRRYFRAYPFIAQHDETDCGAACLAMITKFYGVPVGVARLRDMGNVDRDGATLWSISHAAETIGFHTLCSQLSYEALTETKTPSIVLWEGFHFVVLYEAGKRRVVVGDPGIGIRQLSVEEFRKGWSGSVLEFTTTPRLQKTDRARTSIARFGPIFRPHAPLLGEVLLASFLLSLFGLGIPLFTQIILDRVIVHGAVDLLDMLLFGMLFITAFQAATGAIRRALLIHISTRADVRLIADFLRHVMSLPMRFFDLRRVGDVLSRVSENEKIRAAMVGTLPGIVLDTTLALGYFALLAYYNVRLTLVVLLAMPFFVLLMVTFTPAIRRNRKEHFAKHADQWSHLIESITGIATVKSMGIESQIRWKWENLFIDSVITGQRGAHLENAYSTLAGLFSTVASTLFLWYGAHQVLDNAMSVGQLIAFTTLAANVINPIIRLVDAWAGLQDVRNAVDRLNDVFNARPEEGEGATLLSLPRIQGNVRFENVTFRYSAGQEKPILANLTFDIPRGQTVAVVGRSGSGKTTLAKLILALYAPTEGRVFIDGHDTRALSGRALRRRVGVVPQEVYLFSGTIRENIALGDPECPFEKVVAAARLAGAHEFITEMGVGYDTKVGERGMSLSGGQRQRIALARALLRDPDVLILDEATSALDNESERAIQKNLEEACRGRTTMVIAHRLSTVQNASRILVLDRGALVEEGTHAELLKRGGLYAHLVGQQLAL